MKKIQYILVPILFLSAVAVLVNTTSKALSQEKITQTTYHIPGKVMDIFRHSCINCHGERGNYAARSMINFYAWENYSVKKQLIKAKAIINVLTKNTMPPEIERNLSPQNIPTLERVETMCIWANSLNEK